MTFSGATGTLRRSACADGNAAPQEANVLVNKRVLGVDSANVYLAPGADLSARDTLHERVTMLKNDLSGAEQELWNEDVGTTNTSPLSLRIMAFTVAPEGTYLTAGPVVLLVPKDGSAPRAVLSAVRSGPASATLGGATSISVYNRTLYIRPQASLNGAAKYLYAVPVP